MVAVTVAGGFAPAPLLARSDEGPSLSLCSLKRVLSPCVLSRGFSLPVFTQEGVSCSCTAHPQRGPEHDGPGVIQSARAGLQTNKTLASLPLWHAAHKFHYLARLSEAADRKPDTRVLYTLRARDTPASSDCITKDAVVLSSESTQAEPPAAASHRVRGWPFRPSPIHRSKQIPNQAAVCTRDRPATSNLDCRSRRRRRHLLAAFSASTTAAFSS